MRGFSSMQLSLVAMQAGMLTSQAPIGFQATRRRLETCNPIPSAESLVLRRAGIRSRRSDVFVQKAYRSFVNTIRKGGWGHKTEVTAVLFVSRS